MKIAIFLPNWVGDAVMATPTLRAIRTRYPQAEIVGVLRPYVAEVLAGVDLVDRLMPHEPKGTDVQRRGWRFIQELRREKFDIAVLLPNSLRSAWMAWTSGARRRVGFDRDGRGWLLTDRLIPKSRTEPNPLIDEYLRLASLLGCRDTSRNMELATTPEDERQLDTYWSENHPRLRGLGVICLNPGGAFGSAKHWPTEHFAALARRLAVDTGRTILVLCGPAEREEANAIVRAADHQHVVSFGDAKLSLGLTKAAVRHSELLVTTDSGPRHFAPPFGVPVVTLFGPTHVAWSETYYERSLHLQLEVDCGPCQQRTCPLIHHRCLRELSPDRVYTAARALLERYGTLSAA